MSAAPLGDVAALLAELIAIPSVNPRGAREPAETAVASCIAEWCGANGISVRMSAALDGRANVIATVEGRNPTTALLFESHLDTVEIEAMTTPAFDPIVRDGRMYGRGSCDAKGPLAAFLVALRDIANASEPPPHTVIVAGVIDEEHAYRGVLHLLEELCEDGQPTIRGAVVGEPTGLRAVVAHKGVMRCRIRAEGPGGHTSQPWDVPNPIAAIAKVVDVIVDDLAPDLERSPHPLVGCASLVPTIVAGGSGPNTVPNTCTVSIDRRTLPGEDPHAVWLALVEAMRGRFGDAVIVEPPFLTDLALDGAPNDEFAVAIADTLLAAGRDPLAIGTGWGSDASKIAAAGIPALVLGPGSIDDAHKPDESIDLEELQDAVGIARALMGTDFDRMGI